MLNSSLNLQLSMGTTLLMSYFVFNLSVSEDIPKSAESTPVIRMYFAHCFLTFDT